MLPPQHHTHGANEYAQSSRLAHLSHTVVKQAVAMSRHVSACVAHVAHTAETLAHSLRHGHHP